MRLKKQGRQNSRERPLCSLNFNSGPVRLHLPCYSDQAEPRIDHCKDTCCVHHSGKLLPHRQVTFNPKHQPIIVPNHCQVRSFGFVFCALFVHLPPQLPKQRPGRSGKTSLKRNFLGFEPHVSEEKDSCRIMEQFIGIHNRLVGMLHRYGTVCRRFG